MKERGTINWKTTRDTIGAIQEIAPGFTETNCLIGGSAAWFYKTLLQEKKDPDFPAVIYTQGEEKAWYSKNLDFIGTKREDLPNELATPATGNPPTVKINGVWIDTPDAGLFLTNARAHKTAIEIRNTTEGDIYKVASPTLLYKEKRVLTKQEPAQQRPHDELHLRTLKQAAKLTICSLIEEKDLDGRKGKLAFLLLKEAQEIAPEILEDTKVQKRLAAQIDRLENNPRTKALCHLLKNQVLKKSGQSGNDTQTMPI
jgi:hypothetical protein